MKKLGNLQVLISPKRRPEQELKTSGGLIVPSTFKDKYYLTEGTVVMTGMGTPDIPMEVAVGDNVIFHISDTLLKFGDDVMIPMSSILFITEP